MVNIYYFDGVK